MAGRNSPHGENRNSYRHDGYWYDNQQDLGEDAAATATAAYQQRYGVGGGRGFGNRGYGSSSSGSFDNHRYQDTRYGGGGGGGSSSGAGAARRGGPEGRAVYPTPTAASINSRGGAGTSQYSAWRPGPPGPTRFPNPSTAYGNHAYPSPTPAPLPASSAGSGSGASGSGASGSGSRPHQGFGGALLNAAGHLSPAAKAAAALGKSARCAAPDAQVAARRGLYAPSGGGVGEVPGAASSKGGYNHNLSLDPIDSDDDGEDRFHGRGSRGRGGAAPGDFTQQLQQLQQQHLPPPSVREAAAAAVHHSRAGSPGTLGGGGGGILTANGGGGAGGGGARSRSRSRSGSRSGSRSVSPRPAPVVSPTSPPPPPPPENTLRWDVIEGAGMRQLAPPAEERRVRPKEEYERISPFQGCPIRGCPMADSSGIGVGWMARHLEAHTKVAMERPQKELYIRSTVAEIVHDLCLDCEVPPSQRKFERKKMSSALFGRGQEGVGHLAGVIETIVTGDNKNPNVRRCASDLAAGGCEGTSGGDTIVRCDLCKAWFHISCGQMAIGDGMSTEDSKDETICRTCARISIGVMQGKDPSVAVQRQLALIRERSKTMLAFLEEESRAGAGPLEGVIDLNLSIEEGGRQPNSGSPTGVDGQNSNTNNDAAAAAAAAADDDDDGDGTAADSKTDASATTGNNNKNNNNDSGSQVHGSNDSRPVCAAAGCEQQARTDSKYCCESCGIRAAEAEMSEAIRHSLEMRSGLDRGRRVRETRELKTRKQQIGIAMRKVEFPRVPGFKAEREAGLQAMIVRRCRLWQRLIEIGAYWEKVSGGSKSLAVNGKSATQMKRQVAAANAAANAALAGAAAATTAAPAPGASSAEDSASLVAGGGGRAAANGTAAAGSAEGAGADAAAVGALRANGALSGEAAHVATGASARGGAGDAPPQANGLSGGRSAAASNTWSTVGAEVTREGTDGPVSRPSAGATPAAAVGTGAPASAADRSTPMQAEGSNGRGEVEAKAADRDVWAYGVLDALSVVWYCPPGGVEADRLSSRPQLEEYWRKSHGNNAKVPEHFTFRDRDAPPNWNRIHVDRFGAEVRPAKKAKVADAATAATAGETPRHGAEFSCVYCSEPTGPRVNEHLERCYRKLTARRNQRLKHATLRPLLKGHHLGGGSRLGEVSVTDPVAIPEAAVINSPAAIGRQLLSRLVPYADFDELPDPSRFQLHHDLKGWKNSPSRLDFLYKELVRQRNAAIYELQALDREEAEVEVKTRHDWLQDDLRSVPRGYN